MAGGQIRKHSVSIRGHRTSITLEDAFMDTLRHMAEARGMAVAALIAEIEGNVELSRQGPWGGRLTKQKTALARLVETRSARLIPA